METKICLTRYCFSFALCSLFDAVQNYGATSRRKTLENYQDKKIQNNLLARDKYSLVFQEVVPVNSSNGIRNEVKKAQFLQAVLKKSIS